MLRKHWLLAFLAVVAALVVFGMPGSASVLKSGNGPGDALPVPGGPQTIQVGQRTWYAFQYAGDNSQVTVDMSANPGGSAGFAVWSPNDVHSWALGNKESPMGRGSPNALFGGDLVWVGNTRLPGTYYVVVAQTGPVPGNFNLKVTGSGVSPLAPAPVQPTAVPLLPAAPVAPLPVQPAAPVYTFTRIPPTATPPAQGPDNALAVPSGVQSLAPGHRVWYAFRYAGDKSQVIVDMAAPSGGTSFEVWSPQDVQHWALGDKEDPMGRGSPNDRFGGDLVWVGNSGLPGTYYVVVDQAGRGAGSYTLSVTGTGISSLPTPGPAPSGIATAPTVHLAPPVAPAVVLPVATPYIVTRIPPTPTRAAQNPGDAVPLPSGPQTVDVGQRVWYAFPYGGGDGQILVRMNANPSGSAKFAVWSPEDVRRWANGGKEQPMGQGTPNSQYGGDLVWVGNPRLPGIYYVVVDQQGAVPGTYTLSVDTAHR